MSRITLVNALRFILLILVQILILNKIAFWGFLNPHIYLLFVILLPFETSGFMLLLLSFCMGISIDLFSGTLGLHSASTVFVAYLRPFIIRIVGEKAEYDITKQPRLDQMGVKWFIPYSLLMIFFHHLILNFLDIFSFSEIGLSLFRVFVSSITTFLFVMLFEYLFYKKE